MLFLPRLTEKKYVLQSPMYGPVVRETSPNGGRSTLINVRAEVGEDHRGEGAGEDPREVEDGEAGERAAVVMFGHVDVQ